LTLYNFGFATPQGLPQVSEEFISDIPITLRLTGRDMQTDEYRAAIVGFSSRLNTIAVPQSFMDWANQRYASVADSQPQVASRLIVKVDRLRAAEMKEYTDKHELETSGDKADAGNISRFLSIVSSVVTTNGVVICLLSIFILVLSIFLLLQKSQAVLRNLMLLGYHPHEVARYYEVILVCVNAVIAIVALAVTFLARVGWSHSLEQLDLGGASVMPTIVLALSYFIGITCMDICIVRRRLLHIWRG
jgi:hypothetical protein